MKSTQHINKQCDSKQTAFVLVLVVVEENTMARKR